MSHIENFGGIDIDVGEHFENVPNTEEGMRFFIRQTGFTKVSTIEHFMGVPKHSIITWMLQNKMPDDKFIKLKAVCETFY